MKGLIGAVVRNRVLIVGRRSRRLESLGAGFEILVAEVAADRDLHRRGSRHVRKMLRLREHPATDYCEPYRVCHGESLSGDDSGCGRHRAHRTRTIYTR